MSGPASERPAINCHHKRLALLGSVNSDRIILHWKYLLDDRELDIVYRMSERENIYLVSCTRAKIIHTND